MLKHFCGVFAILTYIFSHVCASTIVPDDGILAICANKTLNLTYSPPLSSANGNPVQIQEIHNNGVWLCQLAGNNLNVTYYVSLVLANATCSQAVFIKFLVYGIIKPLNTNVLGEVFNLTVNFTDGINLRQLNQPQELHSSLDVAATVPTLPANSTVTFSPDKHQQKTCGQISNETARYTVYAYVPASLLNGGTVL